ncbi:MAG: SH3 domain-containing protein [Thermomicrobiaceae bacterium]
MNRIMTRMLLCLIGMTILTGCTLSTSLVPAMSEEDGRFGIDSEIRQPFYSEDDGLHKLTIRFYPEGFPGSQVPVDPAQGAAIEVNYAPGDDPRFPEPLFHEWPEDHEWLPELTGGISYEQTFCSPYPDLAGINLRVATYGADVSAGTGLLEPFETVEVIDLPVVGDHVGFLPGGSEVEIVGTTEGWARVVMGDDERGWIDLDHFAELPEPTRNNDEDVILELYEIEGETPIRESRVNAADMYDISHVPFDFPVLEDSLDNCYRFVLTSPESSPGDAITLRYDAEGSYEDGHALLNDVQTNGDIIFEPLYDLQSPLYSGYLDDYEWAAPLEAFEARFDPVSNTADRYLEVRIRSGNVPMNIPWSRNRPPGQQPLQVVDMPDAPQGGLIFNAAFQKDVPVGTVARATGRDLYSRARQDTMFFASLGVLLFGTVVAGGYIWIRGHRNGG